MQQLCGQLQQRAVFKSTSSSRGRRAVHVRASVASEYGSRFTNILALCAVKFDQPVCMQQGEGLRNRRNCMTSCNACTQRHAPAHSRTSPAGGGTAAAAAAAAGNLSFGLVHHARCSSSTSSTLLSCLLPCHCSRHRKGGWACCQALLERDRAVCQAANKG